MAGILAVPVRHWYGVVRRLIQTVHQETGEHADGLLTLDGDSFHPRLARDSFKCRLSTQLWINGYYYFSIEMATRRLTTHSCQCVGTDWDESDCIAASMSVFLLLEYAQYSFNRALFDAV